MILIFDLIPQVPFTASGPMDLDTRDQNGGAAHDTLGQELQAQEGVFPLESEPLELLPGDETAPSNVTAPADLILPDEPVGLSAEESEKRKRRRQQWEQDQEAKRRWELQRRLADISTDVELLGREVSTESQHNRIIIKVHICY